MHVLRTPRALLLAALPLLALAACADPLSPGQADSRAGPAARSVVAIEADTVVVTPAIDPRLEPTGNPDPQ